MKLQKDESVFSYSLSRPYPFTWFTYVATVGGIVCATLFTFVALAADGYNTSLEYRRDLNRTLNESEWFQKPPFSWILKLENSCQPAQLALGSVYYTSNLGLRYSLDQLWHESSPGAWKHLLPAASYLHTVLEDCDVRSIEVQLNRGQDVSEYQRWAWTAAVPSAVVQCSFQSGKRTVLANFSTALPKISYTTIELDHQAFILTDIVTDNARLWFGAQLTYAWYKQLIPAIFFSQHPEQSTVADSFYQSGIVTLYRNDNVKDYTSVEFFQTSARFWDNSGNENNTIASEPLSVWPNLTYLPDITITLDTFAKSFYSLLLSDFGSASMTNALMSRHGIEWLSDQIDRKLENQNLPEVTGRPDDIPNIDGTEAGSYPINETYELVTRALDHPPDLTDARPPTIYTEYLCSIPLQRGWGALLVSVLVADLVFLQTMWQILNFVTTQWMQRRYEDVNYCVGCMQMKDAGGVWHVPSSDKENELAQAGPRSDSSVAVADSGQGRRRPFKSQTV